MKPYLPLPEKGALTPWDLVWNSSIVADGVYWVHTPCHGGLLIDRRLAATALSSQAQALGEEFDGWLAYEEDCAVVIVFFEHPEWSKNTTRLQVADGIRLYYPEYFQALPGAREDETRKE